MSDMEALPLQNKWPTPEEQALLKVHSAINFASGIYRSFINSADSTYNDSLSAMQTELSELVRLELPIRVMVDEDWFSDLEGDAYFIEKYNPNTGLGLSTESGDGLVWVAYLDKDGNLINEHVYGQDNKLTVRSDNFTDEQIALIFKQGQELRAAGLISSAQRST